MWPPGRREVDDRRGRRPAGRARGRGAARPAAPPSRRRRRRRRRGSRRASKSRSRATRASPSPTTGAHAGWPRRPACPGTRAPRRPSRPRRCPASRRSGSRWRRGNACASSARAPHVVASVRARSSSSARTSAARSRMRRGSTSRTWASGGSRSVSSVLLGREPRQPALHAVEDQALGQPLPLLAAPRLGRRRARRPGPAPRRWAAARGPGRSCTSSRSAIERWSLTQNSVRRSTSSPHRSMRTGASAVDGNTSTIEPRRATSPRCSTSSSRR